MNSLKNTMKPIKWFIIGFCCGMIPYMTLKRGYFAIGGEIFLPFIALVLFEIPSFVKKLREILKGGEDDES